MTSANTPGGCLQPVFDDLKIKHVVVCPDQIAIDLINYDCINNRSVDNLLRFWFLFILMR